MAQKFKPGIDDPQLVVKPSFWQESWIMAVAIILLILAGGWWLYSYLQAQNMAADYLAAAEQIQINKQKDINNNNMETTQPISSGLQIDVLQAGTGTAVTKAGDTISVHYTGTLLDGTKFDSSVDRGQPFSFTLGVGQVIQGWDQGLLNMKVGEKRKLTIPADLGYGSRGAGAIIPPNATLVFATELMAIN
ncbi:MAG: Peptidyl-prolyl cis-trans isomerase [Candidatus Falkowbacteria bacterium GW2011_GWA2_39_24]|uniref:Peptidyl-prolyl cis-trans isomerase n=1 Tax=Candidatus Falkowbacteria bacterium GW2011_GWA2_39_24 TaxID=1618634 RepID=A0A0G0RM49_9BACT|nr:MAG: Peptidyl-prolyl cis-trans isomerase [Candidatus Falkowbacteria bacterium GW2011_GWA2_39_24]